MEFIRSNLLRRHTSATEIIEIDLPTHPLSHLIFTIVGEQATDEATLAEIIAFLNTITVSDVGKTILSCQSEDLYGVNCYLYGRPPILSNNITTDDAIRTLSLIVPFGRRCYDPDECYPARAKGEVTLYADMTALATSIDVGMISIDCVQLPEAHPTHYMRTRQMTISAPGATGDNEWTLPLGNELIAVQIRMTTFPTVTALATGVNKVELAIDEVEHYYTAAMAECMMGENIFHTGGSPTTMLLQQLLLPPNIVYMDFDPSRDGRYLLDLKNAKSAKIIAEMGVDEATNITVIERVPVAA